VTLVVKHPSHNRGRLKSGLVSTPTYSSRFFSLEEVAGEVSVILELGKIGQDLRKKAFKPGWGPIEARVMYPEA